MYLSLKMCTLAAKKKKSYVFKLISKALKHLFPVARSKLKLTVNSVLWW